MSSEGKEKKVRNKKKKYTEGDREAAWIHTFAEKERELHTENSRVRQEQVHQEMGRSIRLRSNKDLEKMG